MKIEDEFGCLGYYGFGAGVAMHRRSAGGSRPSYCDGCPQNGPCWDKHRVRVRRLFPDLMALLDELVARGLRGPQLALAYAHRLAAETGESADSIAPPELHAMMGNMEDGSLVAAGMPPKERGHCTLRYPFES